jgi:hypothetical protein
LGLPLDLALGYGTHGILGQDAIHTIMLVPLRARYPTNLIHFLNVLQAHPGGAPVGADNPTECAETPPLTSAPPGILEFSSSRNTKLGLVHSTGP